MKTIEPIHVGGRKYLPPDEILFLESDLNYTIVNLINGRKLITATCLKKIEIRLSGFSNFYRINKSAIVNLDYLFPENDFVQLPDNRVLAFSRRRGKQWKTSQLSAA